MQDIGFFQQICEAKDKKILVLKEKTYALKKRVKKLTKKVTEIEYVNSNDLFDRCTIPYEEYKPDSEHGPLSVADVQ